MGMLLPGHPPLSRALAEATAFVGYRTEAADAPRLDTIET